MYFAKNEITMTSPCGYVKFRSRSDGMYYYNPVNEEEDEWLWGFSQKNGMIYRDVPLVLDDEPVEQPKREVSSAAPSDGASDKESERLAVKTAKQAYAWFVKWYGADPDRYRRSRVVSLAAEHEVEFPNMTGQ